MSPSAARFTKRYTDTQKNALCKAILLDGLSVREAMRQAEAGQLGIPAFGKPGSDFWGYQLVKGWRERFEAENDDALEAAVAGELKKRHHENLKALRALPADCDPVERSRLMKALADSDRSWKAQKPRVARPRGEAEPVERPAMAGTLASLLALAGNDESPDKPGSQDTAAAG